MPHQTLIAEIETWLLDEALGDPDIVELFGALSWRIQGAGVPLDRSAVSWPTLHPLFGAEQIYWNPDEGAKLIQYEYTVNTEAYDTSPFAHIRTHNLNRLRRRLFGPEKLVDFPVLRELADEGFTDYLLTSTEFSIAEVRDFRGGETGIMASWATQREGGFSREDLEALTRIQKVFAVACHSSIQKRVMANLANAYLGPTAGWRVLSGDIRRGDGKRIKAVVWYADLRGSTRLSNSMEPEDYLRLLRGYYDCTAEPVVEEGGEILEFIGDAVLAIFPVIGDTGLPDAVRRATQAMEKALENRSGFNAENDTDLRFSVSMAVGEVMFGNIGIETRLTFSAIGPVVNAVARMDDVTKELGRAVLVTADVARVQPDLWISQGARSLKGFSDPVELFARICEIDKFETPEAQSA